MLPVVGGEERKNKMKKALVVVCAALASAMVMAKDAPKCDAPKAPVEKCAFAKGNPEKRGMFRKNMRRGKCRKEMCKEICKENCKKEICRKNCRMGRPERPMWCKNMMKMQKPLFFKMDANTKAEDVQEFKKNVCRQIEKAFKAYGKNPKAAPTTVFVMVNDRPLPFGMGPGKGGFPKAGKFPMMKMGPKCKKDCPKAKFDCPKAKKECPKVQKAAPKAKKDAPKVKKDAPKAKKDAPKAKKDAPKAKKAE